MGSAIWYSTKLMLAGVISLFTLPVIILNTWIFIQAPTPVDLPTAVHPIEIQVIEEEILTIPETLADSEAAPVIELPPPQNSASAEEETTIFAPNETESSELSTNASDEPITTEAINFTKPSQPKSELADIQLTLGVVREKIEPMKLIAQHAPFGLPSDQDLQIHSNYIASIDPDTNLARWICFTKDKTTSFLPDNTPSKLAGFWRAESTLTIRLDKLSSDGLFPFIYHPLPLNLVQELETSGNWDLIAGEARIDGVEERFIKDAHNPLVRVIRYTDKLSQDLDVPIHVCIAFDYNVRGSKTTLKHLTALIVAEDSETPVPLVFNIKPKSKTLTRNMLSVDDAEIRHGIELFPELSDELQTSLESLDTKKNWDSFFEKIYPSSLIDARLSN